jgi:hypothetical protein
VAASQGTKCPYDRAGKERRRTLAMHALGSAMCTTSRCLGINPEIRVTSCGQLSVAATYAQTKDVDSRHVPVEHPR